ncbi:UDP-glucosyl transferase 73B1 [Actinidia rufa]|uniref:UDP-glucosyl transferase 73B1 n=1 Tax=Actinidia rufa TaxID=165716 RepID=A0A7J0DZ73_9ERIC|nr:UDP-glucosyl transferase 73B1 [Actinidia rufa]
MASSQTQNQQQLQLHFVIVPLMSQSHLIPMTDFAKLLARRPGLIITIITTPLNAFRYQPVIDRANKSGLGIRLIPLPFPGREAGLPPNCENMDSLASPDLVENFFEATSMLQHPLEKLLAHLHPPPSCIITSNALPWTSKVATKFRIPRYVFNALSCFTLLCSKLVEESPKNSESVSISVRDMRIEFPKAQLPESMRRNADKLNGMLDQMKEAKRSAQGVLVNSLEEMEPEIVEEYKKVAKENVWCIGPVSLCNREISDQFHRGNKAAIDEHDCLKWLDSKKSGSVLYMLVLAASAIYQEEKVLVKREKVKKAIEEVMMDGEEREERRRKRAREFAKMAKKAIEEGGSSYLNITYLIEDVIQHVMN